MVHSKEDYEMSLEASEILFGKGTTESLKNLKESDFLSVFEGVPTFEVEKSMIEKSPTVVDLLTSVTGIFPSKGELRRLMDGGGLSINKEKITCPEDTISSKWLLNDKYILIQKGKKNYNLIKIK
jgi:tyrosyl-tRNA synthetase